MLYVVKTNVWGRNEDLKTFVQVERECFETLEEAKEYIELFESYCKDYKITPNIKKCNRTWFKSKAPSLFECFPDGKCRAWGYVLTSRENGQYNVLKIGGLGLLGLPKGSPRLAFIDEVFRGADEIPKDYSWHDGEYEGWLQFRWGDGKNALDYVEKEKPSLKKEEKGEKFPVIEESDDLDKYLDEEQKKIDNERLKILAERW